MLNLFLSAGMILANMFAKTYGWNTGDWAQYIVQTPDGGFVVQGSTQVGGNPDMLLMRLGPDGTPLWTRRYGFTGNDWGVGLALASDGNIFAASESAIYDMGEVVVMKVSIADGSVIWSRVYWGADWDGPRSAISTPDGGFAVAGWTESATGEDDFLVLKLASDGSLLWSMYFAGPVSAEEDGYQIIRTMGDEYLICGWTESFGAGGRDMFLVKLANSGTPLWARTYGGTLGDSAYAVVELSDATLMLIGQTSNFGAAGTDILVARLQPTGEVIWARRYGGSGNEYIYSAKDAGDGIVMAGYTTSGGAGGRDALIAKIDYNGNLLWAKTFGGGGNEEIWSAIICSDGRIACAGNTTSWGAGGSDAFVLKIASDGSYPGCVSDINLSQALVSPISDIQTTGAPIPLNLDNQTPTQTSLAPGISSLCTPVEVNEVQAPAPSLVVSPISGGILVRAGLSAQMSIYYPDGRLVYSGQLREGLNRITLGQGVYLWGAGGYKGKVAVR